MSTDTLLRQEGMSILSDYTKWQENLYEDMTLDELCKKADAYWNETH